jgi:hypothetical protein
MKNPEQDKEAAVLVRITLPDRHPMSSRKTRSKVKAVKTTAPTTPSSAKTAARASAAAAGSASAQKPRRIVKASQPTPKNKPYISAESRQELESRKSAETDDEASCYSGYGGGGSMAAATRKTKKKNSSGGGGIKVKDETKDAGTLMSLLLPHNRHYRPRHGDSDDDNGSYVSATMEQQEQRPLEREWIHENVRQVQQERIRSSADLRKVRTRQAQEGLRHRRGKGMTAAGAAAASSSLARGGGDGNGAAGKIANPPAKANPFSRFLSVFSVGPSHPEHKRGFWALVMSGGDDDDDDDGGNTSHSGGGVVLPPAEKKPRNSDRVPSVPAAAAVESSASTGSHRESAGGANAASKNPRDPWWGRWSGSRHRDPHTVVFSSAIAAAAAIAAAWVAWRSWNSRPAPLTSS